MSYFSSSEVVCVETFRRMSIHKPNKQNTQAKMLYSNGKLKHTLQEIYFISEYCKNPAWNKPLKYNQWRTQKIFMGGFIQWGMVVIFMMCAFVTSKFDVIVMFPNQRFGEVCWHNMHIFYIAPLILCVIALNINYWSSKLGYRKKLN